MWGRFLRRTVFLMHALQCLAGAQARRHRDFDRGQLRRGYRAGRRRREAAGRNALALVHTGGAHGGHRGAAAGGGVFGVVCILSPLFAAVDARRITKSRYKAAKRKRQFGSQGGFGRNALVLQFRESIPDPSLSEGGNTPSNTGGYPRYGQTPQI